MKSHDHLEENYCDFFDTQIKNKSRETLLKFPPYTFTEEDYANKLVLEDARSEPVSVDKKDIQIF